MSRFAYVFPGQGSQSVGMMTSWEDHQPIVTDLYAEASETLGYDLWAVISEGPEARLNQTEVTQPAMLCAGVATWQIMQQQEAPRAEVMAGHSLGEYTALVCGGSMGFADAVDLVRTRGQLMQSAVAEGEGSMAAIMGLDDAEVIKACAAVDGGIAEAVNFNAPGQVVIAGNADAVKQAMANASDLGAKRAIPLSVSAPSHCSLMTDAGEQLFDALQSVSITMPAVPVIHNQNASPAESVDNIRELLKLQLFKPVQWVACVEAMHAQGVDTLIETGPGRVLAGLTRRIVRDLSAHAVYDAASLSKFQQATGE